MKKMLLLNVLFVASSLFAGPIRILDESSMMNFVADFAYDDSVISPSIPMNSELVSNLDGLAAETDIVIIDSDDANTLTIDLSHTLNTDIPGALAGDWGNVNFRIDDNIMVEYSITGNFDFIGDGSVGFAVSLYEANTSDPIFWNSQNSDDILNESYTIGEIGGNGLSELSGSQTGVILGNRTYSINYSAFTAAFPDVADGQSSTGNLTFTFTNIGEIPTDPPVSVPEPSTISLLASGLLALFGSVLIRRKR